MIYNALCLYLAVNICSQIYYHLTVGETLAEMLKKEFPEYNEQQINKVYTASAIYRFVFYPIFFVTEVISFLKNLTAKSK